MIIGAGSEGAARTSQQNVLIVPNAQWKELGGEKNSVQRKNKRTHLTPTGLLMEGDYSKPHRRISEMGTSRQLPRMLRGQPDLKDAWPQLSGDKQSLSDWIVSDAV
jgi:hypothetical protein